MRLSALMTYLPGQPTSRHRASAMSSVGLALAEAARCWRELARCWRCLPHAGRTVEAPLVMYRLGRKPPVLSERACPAWHDASRLDHAAIPLTPRPSRATVSAPSHGRGIWSPLHDAIADRPCWHGSMAARGDRAAAKGLAHRGSRTGASDACHVERVPRRYARARLRRRAKPVHRRSLATRIIRPRPECCD